MKLRLVDENGMEVAHPYEVRLPGWTEDRYFAEAPEEGFHEFKDGELVVHSPVSIEHQEIVGFLTFLLEGVVSRARAWGSEPVLASGISLGGWIVNLHRVGFFGYGVKRSGSMRP